MFSPSSEPSLSWQAVLQPIEATLETTLEQAQQAEETLTPPEGSLSMAVQVESFSQELEQRAAAMEQVIEQADQSTESLSSHLKAVREQLQKWQQRASRAHALAESQEEEKKN